MKESGLLNGVTLDMNYTSNIRDLRVFTIDRVFETKEALLASL